MTYAKYAVAISILITVVCACFSITASVVASDAHAAAPQAHWMVESRSQPTNLERLQCPSGTNNAFFVYARCQGVQVFVTNVGAVSSTGKITVTDEVPQGLPIATKTIGAQDFTAADGVDRATNMEVSAGIPCKVDDQTVECVYQGTVAPDDVLEFFIGVDVEAGASDGAIGENRVSVTGGGANPQTASSPVVIGATSSFGIFGFGMSMLGADGEPDLLAGDHPNLLTTGFEAPGHRSRALSSGYEAPSVPVGFLKDALVYLPVGASANPTTVPRCPMVSLYNYENACPAASRVGTVLIQGGGVTDASVMPHFSTSASYLYNVVPEQGYPAEFAFQLWGRPVTIPADLVHVGGPGGGYVLRGGLTGIPLIGIAEVQNVRVSFWGNPSAHNGKATAEAAFLTTPTTCSGPLSSKVEVDSWQEPGRWHQAEATSFPTLEGCNGLQFHPTFRLRPETMDADSPSGYDVDLEIPQAPNKAPAIATAQLKNAAFALPQGVVVSPSAANGLGGCAATGPAGINIGTHEIGPGGQDLGNPEATEFGAGHPGGNDSPYDDARWHTAPGHCPAASQIGTVELKTPLLEEPVPGRIFLAKPECEPCSEADASAGRLFGLYLELNGSGVIAKLKVKVSADPTTGRLTAEVLEAPQLPYEEVDLHFDGGPAAALANPQACGNYTTTSDLTPWSTPQTPDATPSDSFAIDRGANGGGCISQESQAPNAPSFEAGTAAPLAGAYSPFVLKVSRADGSQRLERFNLTLPPGLVGKAAGIPYCSEGQIAAAAGRTGRETMAGVTCPTASEVGTVTVGAGPGARPYYVQGHVYWAGPYKGAPLSLVIVTPAVAGPFDLGTVVVRSPLYVNAETTQITAKSDPIPRMLDGVPLDVRSIAVELKRNDFTLNPTNCDAMSIGGEAISVAGQTAHLSNHFQVGSCAALGFKPELKLSLTGPTKRTGHPALKAVVTYPQKGAYANIARAQVGLPGSEFLDQGNLNKVCTKPKLTAGTCPATSIYGRVKAWTPLLDKPLTGSVYLVGGFGYKLPALVADLRGQVRIILVGKVDTTKHHGIRNTFEAVPDAPVSRFVLEMKGGKRYGLFENSENTCRKPQHASARFVAQNGRVAQLQPTIVNGCPQKHKKQ
jgi:hypothetical protein